MKKTRIQKYYENIVVEDFLILYNSDSFMQLPRMERAILSCSSKRFLIEKQDIVNALATALVLTGQKGALTRARKSIAAFAVRRGNIIGCMVTIRRKRMYTLFDKLITFVLPQLRKQWKNPIKQDVSQGSLEPALSVGAVRRNREQNSPFFAMQAQETRFGLISKGVSSMHGQSLQEKSSSLDCGIENPTLFPEIETLFEVFTLLQGLNISFRFSAQGSKQKTAKRDKNDVGFSEPFGSEKLLHLQCFDPVDAEDRNQSDAQKHRKYKEEEPIKQLDSLESATAFLSLFEKGGNDVQKDLLFLSAFQYPQ